MTKLRYVGGDFNVPLLIDYREGGLPATEPEISVFQKVLDTL